MQDTVHTEVFLPPQHEKKVWQPFEQQEKARAYATPSRLCGAPPPADVWTLVLPSCQQLLLRCGVAAVVCQTGAEGGSCTTSFQTPSPPSSKAGASPTHGFSVVPALARKRVLLVQGLFAPWWHCKYVHTACLLLVCRGSFGVVYRAVHRGTGDVVAIKVMDRTKVKAASIERELNVLEHLGDNPYVVGFKGAYVTTTHVSFVMEL